MLTRGMAQILGCSERTLTVWGGTVWLGTVLEYTQLPQALPRGIK